MHSDITQMQRELTKYIKADEMDFLSKTCDTK
jgi:hypothetical protein